MNIRHTVYFKLHHAAGSSEEASFFQKAETLKEIPGVLNFQIHQEISPKNNFDFGFYMEFENQKAYEAYNHHPEHTKFVAEVWMREVKEFQEIDYLIQ